jgi:hypothetical protein
MVQCHEHIVRIKFFNNHLWYPLKLLDENLPGGKRPPLLARRWHNHLCQSLAAPVRLTSGPGGKRMTF